jgi:hypothetical protein
VWWTRALTQVAYFAWSMALGKILTIDNLRKRHVILVDRCCMCKRNGPSSSLRCGLRSVECSLYSFWVMPRRVFDLFACWWTFGRPGSAAIWKMVPTCLLRYVWKEINNSCFEDLEKSLEDVLAVASSSFFFFF